MSWPKTRWGKVTLVAWIFSIAYGVAILATQPKYTPSWGWPWPDWLRDISSAGLAVALLIISIWYGGVLTNYYDTLTGFGISQVRVDRRGADPMLTKLWLDRIRGSKEVTIIGTLSQGWFVVAQSNLKELLETEQKPSCLEICLLDPFGKVWKSRIESGQAQHEKFLRDAAQVFRNVCDLMRAYPKRVRTHLYDTEPLSCVVARGAIYLGLYLPRTGRNEVPEFTISLGSFLGDKVYTESVKRLKDSAPRVSEEALSDYIKVMERHITSSRESFWTDPDVFCDFCKEQRALPSEFSRRYPDFQERTRMIPVGKHLLLTPSLGQIITNHSLIVSKQHVTSSAQMGAEALQELTGVLTRFRPQSNKAHPDHLIFEHGVPFEGTSHGGCGICHCHVHMLPLKTPGYDPVDRLEAFLREKGYKFTRQNHETWGDLSTHAKHSYLAVQAASGPSVFVFDLGERVESQLMRQFLVSDCPEANSAWDWRAVIDKPEDLLQTYNHLKTSVGSAIPPVTSA